MTKTLGNLIKNLPPLEPAAGLTTRVLERVYAARLHNKRRNAVFFTTLNVLSIGSFAWSAQFAFSELQSSEFGTYLALTFSDLGALFNYPREFLYLLAESLPITALLPLSITALLALLFSSITVESVREVFLYKNFKLAK